MTLHHSLKNSPPWPLDPMETDWRWTLTGFHAHQPTLGPALAHLDLEDEDGSTKKGQAEGKTIAHAVVNAVNELTGNAFSLQSHDIFVSHRHDGIKTQAQVILKDQDGASQAGFGWASTTEQALIEAALRIANRLEAHQVTDAHFADHPTTDHWPQNGVRKITETVAA